MRTRKNSLSSEDVTKSLAKVALKRLGVKSLTPDKKYKVINHVVNAAVMIGKAHETKKKID